jgi:hypothetical protein
VVFQSKEEYLGLAVHPDQDAWWQTRMAPLIEGDPKWVDGVWADESRMAVHLVQARIAGRRSRP